MGVLIKGMEMPDNCGACPLETDYGTCGYYSLYVEAGHDSSWEKRRDDCPLVEVPPHGRLIDADALYEVCALDRGYQVMATTTRINEYMQLKIEDAPTIIPAEEGE